MFPSESEGISDNGSTLYLILLSLLESPHVTSTAGGLVAWWSGAGMVSVHELSVFSLARLWSDCKSQCRWFDSASRHLKTLLFRQGQSWPCLSVLGWILQRGDKRKVLICGRNMHRMRTNGKSIVQLASVALRYAEHVISGRIFW